MTGNWDLSYIYKSFDDPAIAADFSLIRESCAAMTRLLEQPGETVETLEKAVALSETVSDRMQRLFLYSELTLSVDATNRDAAALISRAEALNTECGLCGSALVRYVGHLPDLEAAIASSEKLQAVAFALREMKEQTAHLPDEKAEPWLLKLHRSGAGAFSHLRDELDSTLTVNYRGEELSLAAVRGLAYDADPQVRRDAYEAELAAYAKIELPMSYCLNAVKLEARTMAEAKGYGSVLEMTLKQNRTDRETLDAMWTAIREYLPDFRRYMRTKARILGHDNGLPFYDLFAPVGRGGKAWTPEETKEKLVTEMSRFTPKMGEFIANAFDSDWIDLYPHAGKTGGAFCAGATFADRSLIMTNFTGSWSDVCTLVHELGHAWHNRCTAGLPHLLLNVPMMLAETASIFNETMLGHQVMTTASEDERFTLLETSLSDAAQVLVDIYSRYLFETEVVDTCDDHFMSAEQLKDAMLRAQEASYGNGLDPDCRHPWMWACKSHYYSAGLNFYNFPYAFGQLFARGLFAVYQEKGDAFVPEYCALLRACGSDTVANVAARAGIDVRSVDFWRRSLETYRRDIDEFCRLSQTLYGV